MERSQERLTLEELNATYQNLDALAKFDQLFCISLFYGQCLPSESYQTQPEWATAVVPTEKGKALIDAASTLLSFSDSDAALAILLFMFGREPLVDVERTDLRLVQDLLSEDVRKMNIAYPWIYSRDLFDRFFQLNRSHREDLEPAEVQQLLDGMEQGVFQLGPLIVGPFGVLNSLENRFLEPRRVVSLRLCSDSTCDRLHPCQLSSFECNPARVLGKMRNLAQDQIRDWAVWQKFMYRRLRPERDVYNQASRAQLGFLLATAFTRDELVLVLEALISAKPTLYRRSGPPSAEVSEWVTADSGKYSRELSHAQLLQQILRSSDADLVASVDRLVEQGQIEIPPTEIRRSRFPGFRTAFDVRAECSHLGLRFVPDVPGFGPERLLKLVSDAHDAQNSWNVLNFTLRHFEGETLEHRLVKYLSDVDPREALAATVFITEQHLEESCKALGFEGYLPPGNEEDEERLKARMLWKMGFQLPAHSSPLSALRSRLDALLLESQVHEMYSLAQEDRVRSVAVNAFVSLEGMLTDALTFSTWVLLNDHFLDTKFDFRARGAETLVYSLLNNYQVGDGPILRLDRNGRNTLFPLIEAFAALADLCEQVIMNPTVHQHEPDAIPLRERWTQLRAFPLRHDKLLLDMRPIHQAAVIEILRDVPRTLNRANVSGVRNRLSHSGRDFPQRAELQEVIHAIGSVVNVLESSGLYPVTYNHKSRTMDSFGRGTDLYENDTGDQVALIRPSYISECRMPIAIASMIIVPCLPLGPASEPVRFRLFEHSAYRDLWTNLPPRRLIHGVESIVTDTMGYIENEMIRLESETDGDQSKWE